MWPGSGFGNGPSAHDGFNQNDFPSSPFRGATGSPLVGQQGFAQNQQNSMQSDNVYSDAYNNSFQPEVGLYNQEAFTQNQFMNPLHQFSPTAPPQYNVPQQPNPIANPPAEELKAKAAKLKAQLLKGKETRAGSATPPIPASSGQIPRQNMPVAASSSLRGSPKTPIAANETHEQELNDLISQYSESKRPANASVKQEDQSAEKMTTTKPQQPLAIPSSSAKPQDTSLESPTKCTKPSTNGINAVHALVKANANESRHASNGSISEGEILEDTPKKSVPPPSTELNQKSPVSKPTAGSDEPSRSQSSRLIKSSHSHDPRDHSPPRRAPPSNPRAHTQRSYDDRRDEPPARSERRPYPPDYKIERKLSPELERDPYQRRNSRDESYGRTDSSSVQRRDEPKKEARPQRLPVLADILAQDEDLKEWLEITGYHNAPYRDKILHRRRALAKLDAERNKLLADIAQDERSPLPPTPGPPPSASSMLPPPIPNKAESKSEPIVSPAGSSSDLKREKNVSSKRVYSEVEGGSSRTSAGKFPRVDEREPRVKEEEDYNHRRPRSSGFGAPSWSSSDHRDERSPPNHRYAEDRSTRGRGSSRERGISPGRRAYESRPPARSGASGSNDSYHRDEYQERDTRPFQTIGGYKGKAFDPFFKTRARGGARGGRGDYQSREFQSHQQIEAKSEGAFGSRIANGRPFKDHRGFDRGGKGDTRYFIVKSFNEENVLRCIADSVWTTQAVNGSVFREAFESCKNVILVFSINKSKAFQGYARMESLPGSAEVPAWQESINWESAGAFKVKWMVVCSTKFFRIGHLKNALNENQAVLIGKDGQEIEENCGAGLIELIDEEVREALIPWRHSDERGPWEEYR